MPPSEAGSDLVKHVVLDVDAGADDVLAILIFLYAMKLGLLKIGAIICTNGNTSTDHVAKNVVRLLEIVGMTNKIPVYIGAHEPLVPAALNAEEHYDAYFGADGFGDLPYTHEPNISIISRTPGIIALRDIVVNNPKEITVITVGPLTTVAMTAKLFEDFAPNVKDIWFMGGNIHAVGNSKGSAEFNFYKDPEAAYIVVQNMTTVPRYMVPWETCKVTTVTLGWFLESFESSRNEAFALLAKVFGKVNKGKPPTASMALCDAVLAATYINEEEAVIAREVRSAGVELAGTLTRGQVVVDYQHSLKLKSTINILTEFNFDYFKAMLKNVEASG